MLFSEDKIFVYSIKDNNPTFLNKINTGQKLIAKVLEPGIVGCASECDIYTLTVNNDEMDVKVIYDYPEEEMYEHQFINEIIPIPNKRMVVKRLIYMEIWNYKTAEMIKVIDMGVFKIDESIHKIGKNVLVDDNYMFCCQFISHYAKLSNILWNINDYSLKYVTKYKAIDVICWRIEYLELYKNDYVLGHNNDDCICIFDVHTGMFVHIVKIDWIYSGGSYPRPDTCIIHLNFDTILFIWLKLN